MKLKGTVIREKISYDLPLQEFLSGEWINDIKESFKKSSNKVDITYQDDVLSIQFFKIK